MQSELTDPVRRLPHPGTGLEAIVLAGPAVVGVHMRRHHHVAQPGTFPQGTGDTDEQNGDGREFLYRALSDHCGGMISLVRQTEGDAAGSALHRAYFEPCSSLMTVHLRTGQFPAHGLILKIEGGENHHQVIRHLPHFLSRVLFCRGRHRPDQWWEQHCRRPGPVQPRRAPSRGPASGSGSRGDDEPLYGVDFPVEIAGVELGTPYRFVHLLQLGYGEDLSTECCCQCREFEFGSRALDSVHHDPMVIESNLHLAGQDTFRRNPRSTHGIRPSDWFGEPRRDRQVGYGNDSSPWVTPRGPIDSQLLEMDPPGCQSGFLTQLTVGGVQDLLTGVIEESPGQSQHPLMRIFAPLHEQDTQPPLAQSEDHKVNR